MKAEVSKVVPQQGICIFLGWACPRATGKPQVQRDRWALTGGFGKGRWSLTGWITPPGQATGTQRGRRPDGQSLEYRLFRMIFF